jgi:hypothetical protein
MFVCERYTLAVTQEYEYLKHGYQAVGTIIQAAHESSSVKGASRSSHRKRVTNKNKEESMSNDMKKRYRTETKLPTCTEMQCPFSLKILLASDNRWYLAETGTVACSHRGHIFVNPQHLHSPAALCSQEVHLFVNSLIMNLVPVASIIGVVRDKFKLSLTGDQVRRIRDTALEARLEDAISINQTSAERLVEALKCVSDMNYIYVTHKIDSGFVTYKKSRKSNSVNTISEDAVGLDAVQSWRKDLGMDGGDSILVAIAWALDEEIQEFEKFPEYVACDITFGVNRNQRNLALAVVVDGNNRVSTCMRCLMPSKERRAYSWLFSVAFPFLLGSSNLKKVSVMAQDNETNLNQAFISSVRSKNCGWSPYSKLRLDAFHMVLKPWLKIIANESNESILKLLKCWILSWFRNVENQEEYSISRKQFDIYLSSSIEVIGIHNHLVISHILSAITCHEEYCLHFYFMSSSTLLFISDSIVEASNGVLRKHVTANSSLASSSEIQTNITRMKTQRKMWYVQIIAVYNIVYYRIYLLLFLLFIYIANELVASIKQRSGH